MSIRVLVCGGRYYNNEVRLRYVLDEINHDKGISCIIQGAAKGADTLAGFWACDHFIDQIAMPAQWGLYGKSAGYKRNVQMLQEGKPDLVVAFPGGKGTAHMVKIARDAGVEVMEVK